MSVSEGLMGSVFMILGKDADDSDDGEGGKDGCVDEEADGEEVVAPCGAVDGDDGGCGVSGGCVYT